MDCLDGTTGPSCVAIRPSSRRAVLAGALATSFAMAPIVSCSATRRAQLKPSTSPRAHGATGDGLVDDTRAIRAALTSGVHVDLQGLTYLISDSLPLPAGITLTGPGRLVLSRAFESQWAVEVQAGTAARIAGVEIDGQAVSAPVVSGIRVNGATVDLVIERCRVMNLPFDGIDVSGGAGAFRHISPQILNNRVENVGWVAINVEASTDARIADNRVARTGYHAITAALGSVRPLIIKNTVTKAQAPDKLFAGPGSLGGVEGGFMIAYDPDCQAVTIDSNTCDDNRRAGYDGIGVNEDGSEFGTARITRNIVRRAGLFGIDAVGNCVVEDNLIEEAVQQGIHVGLDLGGVIRNVVVRRNRIRNTGEDAEDTFGILIGDTLGPPLAMRDIRVEDNVVLDDRTPRRTGYGIGVVSDEASYAGLSISGNDLARVRTASMILIGPRGPGHDYKAVRNTCLADRSGLCLVTPPT